jgi:hypothetical protein
MRLHKQSISRVNLMDILRRRRKTLAKFMAETGITTFELLKDRCKSMGVSPPTEKQFLDVVGTSLPAVTSQAEGVVVLEAPIELPEEPPMAASPEPTDPKKKKARKSDSL